ncbi:MAG: hypothetical protein AAF633_07020 [Chloroflexota bacterium]
MSFAAPDTPAAAGAIEQAVDEAAEKHGEDLMGINRHDVILGIGYADRN